MAPEGVPLLLDISRTVARARLPAPTGIDRVERAYIDWALDQDARFLAGFDERQYLLGPDTVETLTGWLDGQRSDPSLDLKGHLRPTRDVTLRRAQSLIRREALAAGSPEDAVSGLRDAGRGQGFYLNVGHDNLDADLLRTLGASGWRRVVMLHDVIPLDYPEYARAGTPEKFRAKLQTMTSADHLLFNSQDTADRACAQAGRPLPGTVVPLGIAPLPVNPAESHEPYFVTLGTIEPRKNHALLLKIWAQLWERYAEQAPRLHIVGRRGWENDAVFRILDAAPMMGRIVYETGPVSDRDLAGLLGQTRALLFPSHTEGYGLPLAEALAAGIPAIASDLAALREVGGVVPDWLAPDDLAGWAAAITDYASDPSRRRQAQLGRMKGWQPTLWADHFAHLGEVLETIVVQAVRDR